jgi:ribonuclease P/MRP protein subunit POP1
MRYPVSTGGNPRFGGLKERRQVNFERSVPHFPYDYSGTDAGWAWELREREARKHEWTKRPKGKRIEWATIDLGNGRKGEIGDPWACEWEMLLPTTNMETGTSREDSKVSRTPYRQLSSSQAIGLVAGTSVLSGLSSSSSELFTAKIMMAQRGTPTECARIYQLPTDPELRNKWLSLMPQPGSKRTSTKQQSRVVVNNPEHIQRRDLARKLLEPRRLDDGPPTAGEEDYPRVPDEEDLIGFVTTGNYNLAEGMPTAVADLVVHKVLNLASGEGIPKADRMCIVRQAGSTIGRLATWEVV